MSASRLKVFVNRHFHFPRIKAEDAGPPRTRNLEPDRITLVSKSWAELRARPNDSGGYALQYVGKGEYV